MVDRVFVVVRVAQRLEQRAAQFLVGQRLAVLERHVEEQPYAQRKGRGIEAGQREAGDLQRLGVGREGLGRLAMDVPRELVAQQDQRQRAVGRMGPAVERACLGLGQQRAELRGELGIELGGAVPPHLARLAVAGVIERQQPEIEDIADGGLVAHGMSFLP